VLYNNNTFVRNRDINDISIEYLKYNKVYKRIIFDMICISFENKIKNPIYML